MPDQVRHDDKNIFFAGLSTFNVKRPNVNIQNPAAIIEHPISSIVQRSSGFQHRVSLVVEIFNILP
jgi:hypothetical protein